MKKGFTLIELLAVIVILAIIALIATPIVLNIINDTKESATLRSADFYMDAIEYAIADRVMHAKPVNDGEHEIMSNGNICLGTMTGNTCSDELEVEVNGEAPTAGTVDIREGQIYKIEATIGGNIVTSKANGELINGYQTICKAVTVEEKTTGNVPTGEYNPGDEYLCEVKPETSYRFFVLSTEGDNVNLIMYANINDSGEPVDSDSVTGTLETPWITREDYVKNGGSGEAWDATWEPPYEGFEGVYHGLLDKGPITMMNFLNKATKNWTNIYNLNETYNEPNGMYTNFKLTGKSRVPKLSEIIRAGCSDYQQGGSCPSWMVDYMASDSYYPTRNGVSNVSTYYSLDGNHYIIVTYTGFYVEAGPMGSANDGIRPVITVSKNNIN